VIECVKRGGRRGGGRGEGISYSTCSLSSSLGSTVTLKPTMGGLDDGGEDDAAPMLQIFEVWRSSVSNTHRPESAAPDELLWEAAGQKPTNYTLCRRIF
jgi:hypothetical protein